MPDDTAPRAPRGAAGGFAAWSLAALALLAGYALLWRGGTALAAALLVAGYTVAIPAAILRRRSAGRRGGAS